MPRLTRKLPSYRNHKPSVRAVVTLDGRDFYLGKYGSPENRAEYERVIAEWLARRRSAPSSPPPIPGGLPGDDLTVTEVLVFFWRHAERHYRTPGGEPSSELDNFKDTFRPLKKLYGATAAREFSPLKLKALRQAMIDSGLCRNVINQRIGRIVHAFKWAASEEKVPASVYQSLKTVSGLQRGRTDARESERVLPVPDEFVDAIRPHVSRQIWAMISLQRLTGMRPGEVVMMRTADLDTSGKVWVYAPAGHKMLYRGRERKIYVGPAAQVVLKLWLKADLSAFLFSPREAREERFVAMRAARRSRVQPSQQDRKNAASRRRPGEHYTTKTFHHAVRNACLRADVPHWHPNQLRHNAATRLRKEFGLDTARVILGHSSPTVTEVYAEVDREKALSVMGQIG